MTRCLTNLPRPFIVAVVTDREPAAAVATMRLALLDGAHACEVNLPALGERDAGELAAVFAATAAPAYTTARRRDFMTVYGFAVDELPNWDDEARMERQLATVPLGARAIDIELDTFDPRPAPPLGSTEAAEFAATVGPPAELSEEPAAVARQREAAARVRDLGAEALFSCHTGRPQPTESLVEIAAVARGRGADLVKIVTPCPTLSDLFAALDASARLARESPIPCTVVGAGAAGDISRVVGVNFGAAWAIGQQTLVPGGFHPQPLVAHLRETIRLIPWRAEGAVRCG